MKRRFISMLVVIFTLSLATACSNTPKEVTSVWESEEAGTLTFYGDNWVHVNFKPDFEYLLLENPNDAAYNCDFFIQRVPAAVEEATSFYIWFTKNDEDNLSQFVCDVSGDVMKLKSYWPYDSVELVFTKSEITETAPGGTAGAE